MYGHSHGQEAEVAAEHWAGVWASRGGTPPSWYEPTPVTSLRLVGPPAPGGSVVDVGAGASSLVDHLLAAGWQHVTVLDIAEPAVAEVRARLADRAGVELVVADVLDWRPQREYDVWHDRAVLHFLQEPAERRRYVELAAAAVRPGGALVLGTFAQDGPSSCSGLPTARYSAAELADLFLPHFRLEHAEHAEHRTPSGATQAFTWVVLRRGHLNTPRGNMVDDSTPTGGS
jgi:2-polyprenyl-3-methyl-5-hydroxy-6-metoxy-1,4-benzoquinol methylase